MYLTIHDTIHDSKKWSNDTQYVSRFDYHVSDIHIVHVHSPKSDISQIIKIYDE